MSVKQSVNWLSQQRVDIPDLRSLDSSVIFDFKVLLQTVVGNSPYILRGFTIPTSTGISGAATDLQVVVDEAIAYIPADTDGSFIRIDPGTSNEVLSPNNDRVTGSFTANAVNFVGVRFTRATDASTSDLVSFWDVDAEVEFSKTVPRGLVLSYEFVISTAGFGNTAPIAFVTTNSSNTVTKIKNAKTGLFRLGTGGATPDINNQFTFSTNPENPLEATSTGDPDPFDGGDWEIDSWKEWMDAIMSMVLNMKGGAFWYSAGSSLVTGVNLSDLHFDTAASFLSGSGKFTHDSSTPGLLTWTSDVFLRSIIGPLTYTVSANNVTLSDGEVAFITLVRNEDFQAANTFTFTNGSTAVTATAVIAGIVADDYVKFVAHDVGKWAKVLSVVGSTITLTAVYDGATVVGKAVRAKGTYTNMTVAAALSVPANGNVYWLARRDDNGGGTGRIYLRGLAELEQGEERDINDNQSDDILSYIGATGETDSDPAFATTVAGSLALPNYNTVQGENLTTRVSKITGMLADLKQDMNIFIDPGTVTWDGTNITITSAKLSIPGTTVGAAPVSINNLGSTALPANEALYVDISRTSGVALTLAQATIASLTPSQQRLIIARNLGGDIFAG